MRIYQPQSDFNAESVVLHQYDKAINLLRWLGEMQSWHTANVKEFWEGRSATLKEKDENNKVLKFSSINELVETRGTLYYEEVQTKLLGEYKVAKESNDVEKADELKRTIDNLETLWGVVGAAYSDEHIGEMFRFENDPILVMCVKTSDGIVRTEVSDPDGGLSVVYKRDDINGTQTWYEFERSYTYVVWNGTEFVKQPNYDSSHVGGWFYNVMNIDTCNTFGLSLWAKMIGVVLPEYNRDIDMSFATYYYNKVNIWRQFIRASFFRLSSNGSAYDIARYFNMIFGRVKGGGITITDGGLLESVLGSDYDVSNVMTIEYLMSFEAEPWQEAFLNIGAPNQAIDGIFPHPAGVLSKCYIGIKTDDDVDQRLGLNEHNLIANTGKDISDADTDSDVDAKARKDKSVEGQNLQNLNFYETDYSKYPAFSPTTAYRRGDIVHYVDEVVDDLYRFLSDHKGDWTGTDVQKVVYRSNGGYFAEDDNLNYLGLNERTIDTIDTKPGETYTDDANSDPMNVVINGKVIGQNINNFDHGGLFGYDNEVIEPTVGPFLGLGDDEYTNESYQFSKFDISIQYRANDKVIYNDVPYVFNQSHLGPWDSTHVVKLDSANKYDRNVLNDSASGMQKTTILTDS